MNVIMITEKDAANASLARIADAFLANGDKIKVYAPYFDDKVLCAFAPIIPRYPMADLNISDVEWCDIIFCSTLSGSFIPLFVFTAHKPIFTHNYLMNRQINWGGDISFAPSKATVASDYDSYLNYSYIGIGEPKYDSCKYVQAKDSFLFVDSGHYPFSEKGKRNLAKTLLHICEKYPNRKMVIKPRFLPGDTVITHRNDIHLYDIIRDEAGNKLPANLEMLYEQKDLRQLIDECSVMICMYTTAFVGAIAAGKGLIVLENLDSADVYDIRKKNYMKTRDNMVDSGALVDYRDIDRLLPDGVKGSENYLYFLLNEKDHASDKIVSVCHFLWNQFYSKGLFPCAGDTTYGNYRNVYKSDTGMNWEKVVSMRFHDYILYKSLILIDFHVNAKLDISCVLNALEEVENEKGIITEKKFCETVHKVRDYRDKCIIMNRDRMLYDPIDAGILLNAYYLQKKYEEIRNFPDTDIAAYDLFRAFVALEDKNEADKSIAKKYLNLYFDKSALRKYIVEISDMPRNVFKAYKYMIDMLKEECVYDEVNKYFEMMVSHFKSTFLCTLDVRPDEEDAADCYDYLKETERWLQTRK